MAGRSLFVAAITRTSTRERLVPAHPPELAGIEEPQQLGLEPDGHLADLVQKERSLVRHLDQAVLHLVGAGEGALLVAEDLRLDEVLRQGGAVQGDERRVLPRAVVPDRVRHELLAGAALALDEHRRVRGRHLPDERQDVLELPAFADELEGRLLPAPVPAPGACS